MLQRFGVSSILAVMVVALAVAPRAAPAEEGAQACCSGLEQRVAELEAVAVRKGGDRLGLQIYGQVNRAILFWDDSFDRRSNVVDNTTSSTRLGFIGEGRIGPELLLGYRVEFEFTDPASSQIHNPADVTHPAPPMAGAGLRQAYWYLSHSRLGTISLGRQWAATGTLTLINLGSQMNDAALHHNNAFSIGLGVAGGIFSDLRWGQIAHQVDTLREPYLRYDTPAFLGFVLSAAVGEEVWDVALRHHADWQGLRLASGIGYRDDAGHGMSEAKGALSLVHGASGLYVSLATGWRQDGRSSIIGQPPARFHYGQAGIVGRWLPFGPTTLYADLGIYRNFSVGELLRVDPHTGTLVIWGTLADTEVLRWGYGLEQAFEETGVLLYAQVHRYGATIVGFPCDPDPARFANNCGGDPANLVTLPTRPWAGFVAGVRVRF